MTFLPIIWEMDFKISDDVTKPLAKNSHAMVFANFCTLKNQETGSAERIQLFSQIGFHNVRTFCDILHRDTNERTLRSKKRMEESVKKKNEKGVRCRHYLQIAPDREDEEHFLRDCKGT